MQITSILIVLITDSTYISIYNIIINNYYFK